jgi:hypothetical protein
MDVIIVIMNDNFVILTLLRLFSIKINIMINL